MKGDPDEGNVLLDTAKQVLERGVCRGIKDEK